MTEEKKDNRRFFQRCNECFCRAFEWRENPNRKEITPAFVIYQNEGFKPFQCQHCGKEVLRSQFGNDNLIVREPTGYTKYKGDTPIHWTWYINGTNWPYKNLVDESVAPFKGLSGLVLDVGYGDGLVASVLMKMGLKVLGIEPELTGIKASLKMMPEFKNVRHTTIEEYVKVAMTPVDYLYSLNTIEHVEDPKAFVKVMESVKEFAIIITDNAINKDGVRRKVKELHSREFSYEELQDLFKDFDTEMLETKNGSFIGIKVYAKRS